VRMILDALQRAGIGRSSAAYIRSRSIRAVHDDDYLRTWRRAYERWSRPAAMLRAVLPSTLAVRWMSRRSIGPWVAPATIASI